MCDIGVNDTFTKHNLNYILNKVCLFTGKSLQDIKSISRNRSLIFCRDLFIKIALENGYNLSESAEKINRTHSTYSNKPKLNKKGLLKEVEKLKQLL